MATDDHPRHFAIVPAAGHSRRMGRPKLLLPFGESTVIEAVIAAWQAGGVDQVLVVSRSDDTPLIEIVERAGAIAVTPDVAPPEMKDSVAAALAAIIDRFEPRSCDTWLMAPADIPRLSSRVVRLLIDSHDRSSPAPLVPTHAGRRGHPVLFPWGYAAEVSGLGDHEGVNALLKRAEVIEIEAGAEALARDIDTVEEYRKEVD